MKTKFSIKFVSIQLAVYLIIFFFAACDLENSGESVPPAPTSTIETSSLSDYGLKINEVASGGDNVSDIDTNGGETDYIEIYNLSDSVIDIAGYYFYFKEDASITYDDIYNLTDGFRIATPDNAADTRIQPGRFMVIDFEGDLSTAAEPLNIGQKISGSGSIVIVMPDKKTVVDIFNNDGSVNNLITGTHASLGAWSRTINGLGEFVNSFPTKGRTNIPANSYTITLTVQNLHVGDTAIITLNTDYIITATANAAYTFKDSTGADLLVPDGAYIYMKVDKDNSNFTTVVTQELDKVEIDGDKKYKSEINGLDLALDAEVSYDNI